MRLIRKERPPRERKMAPTAESDSLAAVVKDYWDVMLEADPLYATVLGNRRFDDRLGDITPEGRRRLDEQTEAISRRCRAISEKPLSEADKLTRTILLVDAQRHLEHSSCGLDDWTVDPLDGPQVQFQNIESTQPVRTPAEGRAMVKRWLAIGRFVDDHISNLNRGAREGKLPVKILVEKCIEEIEDLLAKQDTDLSFLRPLAQERAGWKEADVREFRSDLTAATKGTVKPAFARYGEFLRRNILPRSRPQDRPGIMHVEGGLSAYTRLIRFHTSLDLTADQLHQTGLEEVGRINGEMESLGEKVFGFRDRVRVLERLRTDRSLYFNSREEVEAKAQSALSRAKAAIPKWFGTLPRTDCVVVRMEEHEEKHSTIAYYRQPAADGSRPGSYYINTSAPETRPRYEAEALANHESIPGHHLQIARAQELADIPDFRRYTGVTAFVEGWGLYAERLSDEMGLYSSDLDRIGVLSYDSWRACRLVVDTGMHAKGWSREQAIDYMMKNSALAKNNIVNEVDRYITWPGQALAYKTGQLEIMRLRREAEKKLGKRFDIRGFHDAVLGNGAVPLEVLRQAVHVWAESRL